MLVSTIRTRRTLWLVALIQSTRWFYENYYWRLQVGKCTITSRKIWYIIIYHYNVTILINTFQYTILQTIISECALNTRGKWKRNDDDRMTFDTILLSPIVCVRTNFNVSLFSDCCPVRTKQTVYDLIVCNVNNYSSNFLSSTRTHTHTITRSNCAAAFDNSSIHANDILY